MRVLSGAEATSIPPSCPYAESILNEALTIRTNAAATDWMTMDRNRFSGRLRWAKRNNPRQNRCCWPGIKD
jgi:hypothetical protein